MIEITPEYLKMGQTEYEARAMDIDKLARSRITWDELVAAFVKRADASGHNDIDFDGAVVSFLGSIGMNYDLPHVFDLRRLTLGTEKPTGRPNTVKEWIAALRKVDPSLPLFVGPKYTGESSWVHDYPIYTKGLNEMEAGEVGYPHATILY